MRGLSHTGPSLLIVLMFLTTSSEARQASPTQRPRPESSPMPMPMPLPGADGGTRSPAQADRSMAMPMPPAPATPRSTGAPTGERALSLNELEMIALEHNPTLIQAQAQVDASLAKSLQAG